MKSLAAALLCLSVVFGTAQPHANASASGAQNIAERHALIISTTHYEHARDLANPHNDGAAIFTYLQDHGFTIYGERTHQDLSRRQMTALMRAFSASVPQDAIVVVYIAGHGLAHKGQTYLIPADDGALQTRDDLDAQAVALSTLTARLAARRGVQSVVLVDACSANGLRSTGETTAGRMADLVSPSDGSMTLIYAATPGQIAQDGTGGEQGNSPFAHSLLWAFEQGWGRTDAIFYALSANLRSRTQNQQTPWMAQVLAPADPMQPGNALSLPPILFQDRAPR